MANNEKGNGIQLPSKNNQEVESNSSEQNLSSSTENMQRRAKNRLKDATAKLKVVFIGTIAPIKKYIKLGVIIVVSIVAVLILLSVSLKYIWEKFTIQNTDDDSNLPGVTKNVMTATIVTDPNTGETTFVYNEKNSTSNQTNSFGNSSVLEAAQKIYNNLLGRKDIEYNDKGGKSSDLIVNHPDQIKGIDCSSFTSAVLWSMGYEEFEFQNNTYTMCDKCKNGIYANIGLEVYKKEGNTIKKWDGNSFVSDSSIQNGIDFLRAGDVVVSTDGCHHTNIFIQKESESTYRALDCGAESNWQNSKEYVISSSLWKTNQVSYVIRVPGGSSKNVSIESIMSEMSLEEKIYQLMMVQGNVQDGNQFSNIKYGGYIVGSNSNYNNNLQKIGSNYKIAPFVATDDEGGIVTRAASQYKTDARTYGDNKDYTKLSTDETEKSNYLLELGINLNLGPVTDVNSSTSGALYKRSFSGDPDVVKECIKTIIEARKKSNLNGVSISSSLKHYPGYPDTSVNTDKGIAESHRGMDEINSNINVFKDGINAGAQSVMVSNVIYRNYDKENPASLSSKIIGDLRNSFSGVIMTDDIGNAQGVGNRPNRFKEAIMAGNDMILIGDGNTEEAYNQINSAVSNGEISEDQINKSVERILKWKSDVGLLQTGTVADNDSNNTEDSNFVVMTESIVISKNDNGEYCIARDLDARVNEIYKILKDNQSGGLKSFNNEKKVKEALKLWIMAEYSSQYVNLSENVEDYKHDYNADYIQGSIKVKRYSVDDNGKEVEKFITYKDPQEFNQLKLNYQDNGDTTVFDYFTVDSEDNLVIAKYVMEKQESSWTGEADPNVELEEYIRYNISEQKLNYRTMAREYSIPFNLLWAMVVYGKDVSFSNEIAKLVTDSEMVIGIRDNVTTVVTTTVDSYLKEEHTKETVHFKVGVKGGNEETNLNNYYNTYEILPSGNTEKREIRMSADEFQSTDNNTKISGVNDSKKYESTVIKTVITDSVSMEMEYIDGWFAEYKLTYTSNHTNETTEEVSPKENTDYEETKAYDDGKITNKSGYSDFESIINNDDKAREVYNDALRSFLDWKSDELLKEGIRDAMSNWIYEGNPQGDAFTLFRHWGPDSLRDWMLAEINGSFDAFTIFNSLDEEFCKFLGINTEDMEWVKDQCRQVWQFMRDVFYNTDEQHNLIMGRIRQDLVELGISKEQRIVNKTITTTVDVDTKTFNKTETKVTEKVAKKTKDGETESFVSILCKRKHIKAYNGLTGNISNWFFKAIAKNEDTEPFIDLLKYLFYKATGDDYGVTEYDMSTVKFKLKQSGMKNTGIIRGDTVQAKVWFSLKGLGYSDEQVAGVMGNIHHESGGFVPSRVEFGYNENNGGIGLCQWTNDKRGIYGNNTNLKAYAASKGVTWQDEDTQIEFLIAQMTGTGNAAGYVGLQWMPRHGYQKDAWFNATTIEEATRAFCATYENPSRDAFKSSMPERINWAKHYYDEFHGKTLASSDFDNSDFLQLAIEIHDYIRINNFYYRQGTAIPVPEGQQYIDCSGYVSWVLYEYGYEELFNGWQWGVGGFLRNQSMLESQYGWEYKDDPSQAKPGDLLIYPDSDGDWGHIEIYAGGTNQYGAGSTEAIRRVDPNKGNYINQATHAITITKPK